MNKLSNFDFLKDFNKNAYILACRIEKTIYTAPQAVKADATSFLECIVNDMLNKTGHGIDNPYIEFHKRVDKLYEFRIITHTYKTKLLKAYQLRNTIHDNPDESLKTERVVAMKLHRKLFDISWRYYEDFCEDNLGYYGKPKYNPPYNLVGDEKPEDEVIETQDKQFEYCIICGRKNNSLNSNFCKSCSNKIEQAEDLINLRNSIGEDTLFTKNDVREVGYSKAYTNQLILELLNKKLIFKVDKKYSFSEDFDDFIEDIETYNDIDVLLNEFIVGKFKFNQIKDTHYYKRGKKGIKPFVQFYDIIEEYVFKEFINQINLGVPINQIIEDTAISVDEINKWFSKEQKLFKEGVCNDEFITYNKLLMDQYLDLRRRKVPKKKINEALKITDEIIIFWLKSFNMESSIFFKKLEKIKMNLFLNEIKQNKTKKEALDIADINKEELLEMYRLGRDGKELYQQFYEDFKEEYIEERVEKLLNLLKRENYQKAIELSKLEKEDVIKWYNDGKLQFLREKTGNNFCLAFYLDVTSLLMNQYINARKQGNSKEDSAARIGKTKNDIKKWFKITSDDLFVNFKNENHRITLELAINAIKDGKTIKQAAQIADITTNQLNKYIELGKNNEKYKELYDEFEFCHVPRQLDIFLNQISKKPMKKALKNAGISKEELDNYYIQGKNGANNFKEFYTNYLNLKIENYINQIIKGKSESKAIRNSNLSKDELIEHKSDIEYKLLDKQIKIVIREINNNRTTKQAAKKANMSINQIYDWFLKGKDGDEKFKEFARIYFSNYIVPYVIDVNCLLDEDIPLKFILKEYKSFFTKEDYDFWQANNLMHIENFEDYDFMYNDEECEVNDEIKKVVKTNMSKRLKELGLDSDCSGDIVDEIMFEEIDKEYERRGLD